MPLLDSRAFFEWLMAQGDRADEVGALARAMMAGFFDLSSPAVHESLRRARQQFRDGDGERGEL